MRRAIIGATAATLALAAGFTSGALASTAAGPYLCAGTLGKPGVLKGTYPGGVIVKGVCAVKAGKARVIGTLRVSQGSTLIAAYGLHHSSLTVTGDLVVAKGGAAVLGCKANPNGTGLPCLDETNTKHPTLTSHEIVSGNIIESSPLGVIMHNSAIGGNIKETGGGGGLSCNVPKSGVFAKIKDPVFSDLEDSTVGGSVTISGLTSCWTGLARDTVHGNVTINNNDMGDPDAIEVLANTIGKNLSCSGNTHPSAELSAGALPIWDTADEPPKFLLYPRMPEPNTVGGTRSGQCVTASPTTLGGPPAAAAF